MRACFCQNSQLPMYFLPKSRASMDQAPGPISASVPPKTLSVSDIQMSLPPAKRIQNSMGTTNAPAKGVHSPAKMNSPRTAPVVSGIVRPALGASSCTMPLWRRAIPVKSRWTRRPAPGQPFANVENSRCKRSLAESLRHAPRQREALKGATEIILSGDQVFGRSAFGRPKLDDSALQRDGDRMARSLTA